MCIPVVHVYVEIIVYVQQHNYNIKQHQKIKLFAQMCVFALAYLCYIKTTILGCPTKY